MNRVSSRTPFLATILGAALVLSQVSSLGQVNSPPDGFGILPDEVGIHFGPASSAPFSTLGESLLDAAPDGEFVTAPNGVVLWALRHTPSSGTIPGPVPLDEVDVHRRNSGGQWIYESTLIPPSAAGSNSEYGAAVVASGNRLFIGAPGAVNSASVAGGVVYVYEFDGIVLTPVQTLELADGVEGDRFGASLAVDGGRLLVGAPGRDKADGESTVANAGAAYFFELNSTWSLVRTEWSTQPQADAQFGFSVGLSGRRFAVGAPFEDGKYVGGGTPVHLTDAGAVYLGRWDAAVPLLPFNNLFSTYAPVQASIAGLAGSHFGWSVAVDDRMRVAVSMPDSSWMPMDNMVGWDSGVVMVMHWNGKMSPDEAFVRTSFSHGELSVGARFGEHLEAAAGSVDFGVATALRTNNARVHYYVLEAIQAQPGAVVGSVETPRRVGDLVAADPENVALTLSIPSANNPHGTHFEISASGELRAKSSLGTLLDGVYPVGLNVSDGVNGEVSRVFQIEVTGAVPDADRDKMADAWELAHGLNPAINDAEEDPDQDGLTNLQEYSANKDPMDPEGPLLMGGYIDLRPFLSLVSQDKPAEGTVTVADGGQGLALTGNRWVRVPFDYTVTPNTVLEFEFRGTTQGEIHGLGLDEDVNESNARRLVQVWGVTTNFDGSIVETDFDAYKHHANNWAPIRVRIGQSYTGAMHHLIIANDDDELPQNSNTEIRKVRVYEAPARDQDGNIDLRPFGGYALAYDGDKPKQGGSVSVSADGKEIQVTGNRWLQWLLPHTVTPLTVVEFSYKSNVQGEVHGIGLDEDTQLNNNKRLFQFHGTQYWENAFRVGTSDWYAGPSGTWKNYRIGVGKSYTGAMRYLVIGNDHDITNPNASASFKNIRVYNAPDSDLDLIPDWWEAEWGTNPLVKDATLDPDDDGLTNLQEYQNNTDPLDPEGPLLMGGYLDLRPYVSHMGQDVPTAGTVVLQNKGETMTLTGNRWVRVPFDYNVTPNTVMEFEFQGTQQGEIHAVGLDDDTLDANGKRLCQLWGTDPWTNAFQPGDYDGYSHHTPDWKTYRIRVGRLATGAMHHFFVVNDDDNAPQDSSMTIRKVRFYEAPIVDGQGYIDLRYWSGYGLPTNDGDAPKTGAVTGDSSGREISIQGNRWLQVLVDYPVTPRTVVEFSYRSDVEGESHGLGLDENTQLGDAARVFRFHGTQASNYTIPTSPSLRYREAGGWRQYRLPVGRQYPAAVMRYLVLANDDDRPTPLASAAFKDIKIYEVTDDADADGIPNSWETAHALNPNSAADASADPDHDGLSNLEEYEAGTNPDTPDSDEDSLRDNLAVGKLAGYWKMDVEGPAGHEIADSTPSNADGTAHQQARIESESGIAGTAALQLGLQNESRVTLPPDLFEWQPDTTLAFWMKSSTQGEMSVLSAPSATNDNAYLVLLKDRFLRLYTGLHSNDYVEWEPALTDGQWHHVVVVRQGSANKASLYVDGVSFGERSGTFVTQDIDLVVLGHEADSVNGDFVPSQRFRGFLDEVRFYQRAVTSAEAKSLALWQPRLQNQDDLDHDGMADAWELAHQVTDPQADHDGDGRTNVQEFLSNSDPWDYYNGRPPVLTDVFNPSGGTDLLMRLGIRDPGAADDDSWRAYINGTYIGRNLPTGSSSSDFNYSNILYLPIGLTGTFTFQIIYDGNEDGSSFQLDLQFLNSIPYTLTGYSTLPQGSGYQFTIDVSDDFDNDGLMNAVEVIMTTDPWDPDTDDDGLPDGWEISYDLNPKDATGIHGGGADADDDGLTNLQEYEAHTSPRTFDSDGDLLPDGWELAYGGVFSPLVANDRFGDEDGDGLTNLDEKIFQTDPLVADTDGDGTSDGDEVSQAGLPNDVGDFGLPPSFPANRAQPNPGDAWALKLEVGDPTGGHSERYTLVVRDAETGAVLLEHEGGTFGQPSAREYSQFRHGKNYTFQLKWNGSAPILNLAQPDFDGVASVKLVGLPAAMDWTSLGYRLIDSIDTTTWSPTASPQVFTTWNDKFSFKADAAKHETVLIWLSDQQTDSDGDGLVDSEERHIYGTNPALADTDVDGIPDGWEVRNGQNPLVKDADADPDDDHLTNLSEWQHGSDPRLTDTDEDGLPDGWEVSNGTNPANAKDRLEDKDGDRVPNYVEFLKGTLPNDNQSLPAPDVVVDSQLASASSSDNIFATLQEAYSALPSPSGEPAFSVIRVVPGKYAGLDGHLQKKQVVWLADETGSVEVTGSFAGFWLAADTVVSGFQFQGLGVNVASTGVLISGSQSSGGSAPDVRLINCFFRNHHCGTIDNTAAGRRFAGGVINEGGEVHVLHCTFWNNTGTDADAVVNRSGTVQIVNSVIWNPGQSSGANQAIWEAVLGQNVKVIDSLIQGSTENESIEDPGLTLAGNITADSLAKDMGTVSAGVLRDIYGTVRPQGAGYDLGAEEWLDTDGDNLPDWWESRYGFDPQASTDQNDTDNDGAGRLAEFMAGSDPTDFFSKPGASLPVLEIVGGNNQRLDAGQVTPQPLEVCVRDQVTNELLVAAPIDFTIVTGGGVLYETAGGQPIESTPVRLQTDSEGKARIYYKQPASPQYRSTIRASAGTSATVEFSLFDTAFTVQPDSITATISAGTSENSELTLSNQTSEPVAYNLEVENGAALFSSGDDYQWKKTGDDGGPAYQWTDISTTGSRLATVSDGDDVSQEVSLAFSFPFYDGHFETVFVHSNGYLTFGAAATQTAPDSIPGLSLPPNLVAGLFVDMDGATSGDVYCFSDSEKCIIQYQDAKFQWWDGKATFQIVLHKGGRIELIYKELTGDFAYSLTGIQNGMKSKGVEVSYFTYVLQSEMAVVLHREHQWLSVAAPVGQLGVGESVSIPITLNASKLESGSFEGVVLVGNDLASGAVEVPVMMTVDSLPTVSITQPSADFVHNPGSSVQLAAQANDMEGPISKVEFYIDGLRIAEDATAPYETTWWPNLSAGDHELVVKAYDTQGGVGVSVPRIVGAVQESRLSLEVVGGNSQIGQPEAVLPQAVVLMVKTSDGSPAPGVPVRVLVSEGDGLIRNGTQQSSLLELTSDSLGKVTFEYKLGSTVVNKLVAGTLSVPMSTASVEGYASSGSTSPTNPFPGGNPPGSGGSNSAPNPGGAGLQPVVDPDPEFPGAPHIQYIEPITTTTSEGDVTDWTQIKMVWQGSSHGTDVQYAIERKVSTGPWTQMSLVGSAGISPYFDEELVAGKRYLYRIHAVVNGARIATSNIAPYLVPEVRSIKIKESAAFGSKGGAREFQSSGSVPQYYLTTSTAGSWNYGDASASYSGTVSSHPEPNAETGNLDWSYSYTGSSSFTSSYQIGSSTCDETGAWSGTSSNYSFGEWISGPISWPAWAPSTSGMPTSEAPTERSYNRDSQEATVSLSGVYSTGDLITDVHASFPEYKFVGEFQNPIAWYEGAWSWSGYTPSTSILFASRLLWLNDSTYEVRKIKYQFTGNPSQGAKLEWFEVFEEDDLAELETPVEDRIHIVARRSWSLSGATPVSEEYELDASTMDKNGQFYLMSAPQLTILETGFHPLDEFEEDQPRVITQSADGRFYIESNALPWITHTISWTGGNGIKVFLGGVEVLNGQTFTREQWDYFSTVGSGFRVVVTQDALPGTTINITLTSHGPGSAEIGSDQVSFKFEGPEYNYTVPVDEASGARYRKIALNGRPLPDGKPQTTEESDQQPEDTFVDALTLGLRHNVSDIFCRVPGSDLSLQVRRSILSEIWSERSGLRPNERPDRPFGTGWSTNLTPHVAVVLPVSETGSSSPEPLFFEVVDEDGNSYRFLQVGDDFVPFPTAKHEGNTFLASLAGEASGDLVFRKKFGTTIVFRPSNLMLEVASDRLMGSDSRNRHHYYRAVSTTDRLGQKLQYEYQNDTSLVPKCITVVGRPDLALFIRQNEHGLITSIWDPNWNETKFEYEHDALRNTWLLVAVRRADGTRNQYGYEFVQEAELKPRPVVVNDPGTTYIHCDLTSVTDPNGNTYSFEYMFDHSGSNVGWGKYDYQWSSEHPEISGYYVTTGHARMVKKVTMPGNKGIAEFQNLSKTKLVRDADGVAALSNDSVRKTRVWDAEGHLRTYEWSDGVVCEVNTLGDYYPSPNVVDPKIVYYRALTVTHDGYGTESFTFDENAGLALKSARDLSGNLTTFFYDQSWQAPQIYRQILPLSLGLNGRYDDPTRQTNALGKSRTFTYDERRIMTSVVDEEGRKTTYLTDSLGRRTRETIEAADGSLVQQTDFTYGDSRFPGLVTHTSLQNLVGGPAWETDLVTQSVPDSAGRIMEQIVDAGGLNLKTSFTYAANGNKLTATDPNGNTTWFFYDSCNRLWWTGFQDGSHRELRYDARGNKVRDIDEKGNVTIFEYDALNRVVKQARDMNGNAVIDTPDLVSESDYNAVGSVTMTKDPEGNVTTFVYDGLQRLEEKHQPLNITTTFQYGANSGGSVFDSTPFKPTRTEDPRGYVTGVTYDALYRPKETRVGYGAGIAVTHTEYDDVGNAVEVIDPLDKHTVTDYDALNRPTAVHFEDGTTQKTYFTSTGLKWKVEDELGRQTLTEFDGAGRPIKVTQPAVWDTVSGQIKNPVTRTEYDDAGNAVAVINARGQRSDFGYDARNRKVSSKLPEAWDAERAVFVRATTVTDYDPVGNVVKVTDSRGYVTDTTYDEANRIRSVTAPIVEKPDGTTARPVTFTTYYKTGTVRTVTDPNGHVTTNTYDALNRLRTTTDAEGIVVTNEYDKVGSRTAVIDGKNQRTEFEYDGLNRNTVVRDALSRETVFEYNDLNKTARVDAEGQRTEYRYDDRHRLETVTYIGRAEDNRVYDYDPAGNLLSVTESGKGGKADVAYTYDVLNRVESETSGGLTHQYRYDLVGNRTLVIYGGTGREIVSTYDSVNRLATMKENGRTTSYAYNAADAVSIRTLPNGDSTSTIYDALNRAVQIQGITASSGLLYTQIMKHDLAGSVVQISEIYPSGLANRTVVNTYDDIYRLVNESITTAEDGTVSITYGYDDANNRAQKVVVGSPTPGTTDYVYNSINQLTSWTEGGNTVSYTYDLNGNRESRTQGAASDSLGWDYENRLISFDKNTGDGQGLYTFVYDYRTRRIETVKDADPITKFVFSGGASVQEVEGGVLAAEFVRGSDIGGGVGGMLYSLRSGTPSYTHYNARGDVVAKTDGVGALTYQAAYEAWGEIKAESGSTQDRQKSNSKDRDVSGYVNEGFRYRDIESGAFLSKDPSGFVDGPNLYAYVLQNPWSSFDPDGLKTISNYLHDTAVAKGRMAEITSEDGWAFNRKKAAEWDSLRTDVALYESKIGEIVATAKAMSEYTGAQVDATSIDDEWSTYKSFNQIHFWHKMNPEAEVGDKFNRGDVAGAAGKLAQDAVVALLAEAGGRFIFKGVSRYLGAADDVAATAGGRGLIYCFPAGTMVLMADGSSVPIEQVVEGDIVLAAEPETESTPTKCRVLGTLRSATYRMVDLKVVTGSVLKVTGEHPIWTLNRGWQHADDLVEGDLLLKPDGSSTKVSSVEINQVQKTDTFNLCVEGVHTFYVFVGRDAVLVHNTDAVLGLDRFLPQYESLTGGSAHKNWIRDGLTRRGSPGSVHFGRKFNDAMANATRIHFALDGIDDVKGSIYKGRGGFPNQSQLNSPGGRLLPSSSGGGFTDAELRLITRNPDLLNKTTFYRGGQVVTELCP